MSDEIASKTEYKDKKVSDGGKRNKAPSEIKPVKNISKKTQSFQDISPM